ncbi:MAG: XisH family protein [Bacteroidia bacterium]|nr:XisH family protein [Bacteroidia bacterium]
MSRRDFYHNTIRIILEKEHWTITDDPLDLSIGDVELFADIGAERVIGAEKGNQKIALEIKSFISQSPVSEFHKALGQYENYRLSLEELDPNRHVWLAISKEAWDGFFQREFIQKAVRRYLISIVIFDVENHTIISWIKP